MSEAGSYHQDVGSRPKARLLSAELAGHLSGLLSPGGALEVLFSIFEDEISSRAQQLAGLDLEGEDSLRQARKIQGEIRGGLQALERLKEIISEHGIPNPPE